jgi:formylglycine-generating enzyme required for sulfatase activity
MIIGLLGGIHQAVAQGARFFRISGPANAAIIAFRPDGTLVWSNSLPGTNYTIQTVTSLPGGTNWVDYVQIPVTTGVNTNLLVAFNPPAGMTLIPAGVFTMGDIADDNLFGDAAPTNVTVSAFYMDVNLVSYSQWQSVYNWATNHGYGFLYAGAGKAANHPVQTVDWYDTLKWCNARSQQAGLTPVYYLDAGLTLVYTNGHPPYWSVYANWSGNGYRLPTEAEWEKAARGGLSGQRFPWGDTISESQANYYGYDGGGYDLGPTGYNAAFNDGVMPYTSPVGYFAPNGYGLYDMAGNVWEWCWDSYETPYAGGVDPHGPMPANSSQQRVMRGGDWDDNSITTRCGSRFHLPDDHSDFHVGFRCVRGL